MQTLISTDGLQGLPCSLMLFCTIRLIQFSFMPNTSCGKLPKLPGCPQYNCRSRNWNIIWHWLTLSETQLQTDTTEQPWTETDHSHRALRQSWRMSLKFHCLLKKKKSNEKPIMVPLPRTAATRDYQSTRQCSFGSCPATWIHLLIATSRVSLINN